MTTISDRSRWIAQRIDDMMINGACVANLVDEIQKHGGIARMAFFGHIHAALVTQSPAQSRHEMSKAETIMRAFAHMLASREYDARPLCEA